MFQSRRFRYVRFALALLATLLLGFQARAAEAAKHWYKGETHAHSLWSDGDEFPEMVFDWYKTHGYQFLAVSDHNVVMVGERWRDIDDKQRPIPEEVLQKYRQCFGGDWVETRTAEEKRQVRLKTFDEIRPKLEEPGKFLMIPNEEITARSEAGQVHFCVINLGEFLPPQHAPSIVEMLQNNQQVIDAQAKRLGRTIVGHLNHPNWTHYDVRAEDILAVPTVRLMEVFNGNQDVNDAGDAIFPSNERLWDLVNTVRIAEQKRPPLWGVATDDAHHYHRFTLQAANPGRGWVMVRAAELTPEAIAQAMDQGDFYASTGVVLRDFRFDTARGTLTLQIDGKPGIHYTTRFLGTRDDFDRAVQEVPAPDYKGQPQRPFLKHSDQIGQVLATVEGTTASYTLQGNELYVRAVVTSDEPVEFPVDNHAATGMAWTQPVVGTRN